LPASSHGLYLREQFDTQLDANVNAGKMTSPWKVPLLFATLSICACSPQVVQLPPTGPLCRTEAHFSRRGGAADSVVQALNGAQKTIYVAMYGLTYVSIVDALVAAKMRGVDVSLKLDKLESAGKTQAAMIAKLEQAGIPVEVSMQSRLLHHKFAVIDGRYVITGSFNWTTNAEQQNRENLVILECPELAQAYSAEWDSIQRDKP
jgi:phosphatidylserine/phosphatidylglycerophosphate/cardiolipin synthase-like enzyme